MHSGSSYRVIPAAADATSEPDPTPVSVVSLVNVVLRYRRQVLVTALLATAASVGLTMLSDRTYTATATFLPQSDRPNPNMAGLAAQFGLNLQTGDGARSPQFYADLLKSRGLLHAAVTAPLTTSDSGAARQTLAEVLGGDEPDPALRQDEAARELGKRTGVGVSTRTGVVTLTVRLEDPELAREAADQLLRLLNQFNLQTRRSQASAEREFVERRLEDVRRDLRAAEARLEAFYVRNRDYGNSPMLRFEQERLAREVSLQQQLFSTLVQSYEQAKIDEVRDTPVITLIEPPVAPIRPDARGLPFKAILGFAVGAMLGILIAFVRHALARARNIGSAEYEELSALGQETLKDLKHPWRLFTRRRRGREPA